MSMGTFTISRRTNGDYQFNLKAANGQTIMSSEGYTSKAGCLNGIGAVRNNAPLDNRYERLTATNGNFYFRLKAGNGETIGISEMYFNSQARENGIESVKTNAPNAPVTDFTA